MVGHKDFIRNEKYQITLIIRTLELVFDRIELEREIVAECTIKAEICIFFGEEKAHNRTQHGKDRRHTRAFFFNECACRVSNRQLDKVFIGLIDLHFGKCLNRLEDRTQQDRAALVQRFDTHLTSA